MAYQINPFWDLWLPDSRCAALYRGTQVWIKGGCVKSIYDQRYIEVVALVRKARERSGLTQFEVAQRLGRPQSYLSKIETCERRVDLIELMQLCRAIGATLPDVIPVEFRDLIGDPGNG